VRFPERQVGGDDQAAAFVSLGEDLEDELGGTVGQRRIAQLIAKVTVEPVYGQIRYNRHIDRFMRRGGAAAQSEWRLVGATHNLLKLHSHWMPTPPDATTGGHGEMSRPVEN
jgi:hypothetical protein